MCGPFCSTLSTDLNHPSGITGRYTRSVTGGGSSYTECAILPVMLPIKSVGTGSEQRLPPSVSPGSFLWFQCCLMSSKEQLASALNCTFPIKNGLGCQDLNTERLRTEWHPLQLNTLFVIRGFIYSKWNKYLNIFTCLVLFSFKLHATQGHAATANGCISAESEMRWLKGFIVNDDDIRPLMENLLAHRALVSVLVLFFPKSLSLNRA